MDIFNKRDADLITIGEYISFQVCGLKNTSTDWYLQVGKDYADFADCRLDVEIHREMKELLGGFDQAGRLMLILFLLQYDKIDRCCTKFVELRTTSAVCKIRLFKNVTEVDRKSEPFYVQDFVGRCNTFVVLDGLQSCRRDAGKDLIQRIQTCIKVPILIQAGFLYYGDYEVEAREMVDSGILDSLEKFYKDLNFVNVNERVGQYEDSIIMLYDSKNESGLCVRSEVGLKSNVF